jgi:hypothetical protein
LQARGLFHSASLPPFTAALTVVLRTTVDGRFSRLEKV